MTKFTMWKKVTKNVLTIIPKPHAHPHTVKKTYAKFQNNQYKTVSGIALTSIDCVGLFVLRFYGPVNPMGSCRARSVYLTTHLLGRLSPLSG